MEMLCLLMCRKHSQVLKDSKAPQFFFYLDFFHKPGASAQFVTKCLLMPYEPGPIHQLHQSTCGPDKNLGILGGTAYSHINLPDKLYHISMLCFQCPICKSMQVATCVLLPGLDNPWFANQFGLMKFIGGGGCPSQFSHIFHSNPLLYRWGVKTIA